MKFREKLKALRIARGFTQEVAAEALGVSAQTVSKWERGLLSPDIALLPKLAVLYRCSIDSLFDMESCWEEDHREKFKQKIHALHTAKDYEGVYKALIAEIELQPDVFLYYPDVMLHVLRKNLLDDAHVQRMLQLAEYADRYCTDDDLRSEIHRVMVQICKRAKRPDKATEYYQKLPLLRHSRDIYAKYVMEAGELHRQTQKNILSTVDIAACAVCDLITPEMSAEEKLFYYRKAAALWEITLDGKYGGFYEGQLLYYYKQIAVLLSRLGQRKEAYAYIQTFLSILERQMTPSEQHEVSPFVHTTAPQNHTPIQQICKMQLSSMLAAPELAPYKDKLAAFAKAYNDYFGQ